MSELKTSSAAGWDFCQDFSCSVFLLGFSYPLSGLKKKEREVSKKTRFVHTPSVHSYRREADFIILFHCGNTEGKIVETKGDD